MTAPHAAARASRPAAGTDPEAQTRHCLKCRRRFASEGPHHRICRTCKRVRSPDEADPETLLDSEASRARRERGLRLLMGLPPERPRAAQAVQDMPFRGCQWIAGEPSADDSCKCGASVVSVGPYCARHLAASHLERPKPPAACPRRAA